MSNNFIFLGSWYDKLMEIEDETERNDFAWRIIKYGATGELEKTGDGFKDGWLRSICDYISVKQQDYEQRRQMGKTVGRAQCFDREQLKEMIAAGKSAVKIAEELGVDKSAIYHDKVWTERKINNFYR